MVVVVVVMVIPLSLSLSLSLSKMATELFVRLGHVVGKMKLPLPVRIVDLSLK